MHQFGCLSERGGNFINLLQKARGTWKMGGSLKKEGGGGGGSNPVGNYADCQVCLSMYDLLLPSDIKGLKGVLEILKEQSDKIRSTPFVIFEKAFLKFFLKISGKTSVTGLIFNIC